MSGEQATLMLLLFAVASPTMTETTTAGPASDKTALRTVSLLEGAAPGDAGPFRASITVSQLDIPPTPTRATRCQRLDTNCGPESTRPLNAIQLTARILSHAFARAAHSRSASLASLLVSPV